MEYTKRMELRRSARLLGPVFLAALLAALGLSEWKSPPQNAPFQAPGKLSADEAAAMCAEHGHNPNALLFVSCAGFLE